MNPPEFLWFLYLQVGIFPQFSGEEFDNYTIVAKKLRPTEEFFHTSDAKLLPRGESSVTGPLVRLFKPFDELFVDTQVMENSPCLWFLGNQYSNISQYAANWDSNGSYIFRILTWMLLRNLLKNQLYQL